MRCKVATSRCSLSVFTDTRSNNKIDFSHDRTNVIAEPLCPRDWRSVSVIFHDSARKDAKRSSSLKTQARSHFKTLTDDWV
jgi:hypothetical protein